jgi:hypothetical protein
MTKIVQIGLFGVKIIVKKAPNSNAKRGYINYLDKIKRLYQLLYRRPFWL